MTNASAQRTVGMGAAIAATMSGLLVAMDTVMMPIATSAIVQDLRTNVGTIQAAVAISSLVAAPFYITGGRLGDIYGRKKLFAIGLVLYGIGTLAATVASSPMVLLAGWAVVRPLGMALTMPLAIGLIIAHYTDESRRGQAFSIRGAGVMSATLIGPLLMGYSADALSWRVAFGIETLLAAGAVFLTLRTMHETKRQKEARIDWTGTALTFLAVALILVGSMLGGPYGWFLARKPFVLGNVQINPFGLSPAALLIGLGILSMAILLSRLNRMEEAKVGSGSAQPLFSMKLFQDRTFSSVSLVVSLYNIVSGSVALIIPVFLQQAVDFNAMETAVAMVAFAVGAMIVASISGKIIQSMGNRTIVQVWLAGWAVGLVWLFFTVGPNLTWPQMLLPMFVLGAGAGMSAQIPNVQMATISAELEGQASGFAESGKELGSGLGAALITSIMFSLALGGSVDAVATRMGAALSPEQRNAIVIQLEEASFPDEAARIVAGAVRDLDTVVKEVYVDAFKTTLGVLVGLLLVALLLASFVPNVEAEEAMAPEVKKVVADVSNRRL